MALRRSDSSTESSDWASSRVKVRSGIGALLSFYLKLVASG
jgi:hypothetical protein